MAGTSDLDAATIINGAFVLDRPHASNLNSVVSWLCSGHMEREYITPRYTCTAVQLP